MVLSLIHIYPCVRDCLQRGMRALQAETERLLAENILACVRGCFHRRGMKLVWRSNQNGLNVSAFQHCLQAGVGVLNLKPVSYTHLDVYKRQPPAGEIGRAHV